MKTYGLRDIIGPVMVGPSSSHTAGALAIAAMARRLCAAPPARASFTLYGSFAHTGRGHGTDKALVAGLLGLDADDLAIRDSFALAEKAGLAVEVTFDTSTEPEHPNTVDIAVTDAAGGILTMRGVSVGGGAAVITRVNGVEVNITGEHTSVVVHQHDVRGVLAHISSVLASCGINIATANLHRTEKRGDAFTVLETDDDVDGTVRDYLMLHPSILDARVIPAMSATDGEPVEVPADADFLEVHDVIDHIERELKARHHIETSIHMDPVVRDGRTEVLRGQVAGIARELDPALTIHDFRITAGPIHTNLVFDVVVPYGFALSDSEVRGRLSEEIKKLSDRYFSVIQVDHSYVEKQKAP